MHDLLSIGPIHYLPNIGYSYYWLFICIVKKCEAKFLSLTKKLCIYVLQCIRVVVCTYKVVLWREEVDLNQSTPLCKASKWMNHFHLVIHDCNVVLLSTNKQWRRRRRRTSTAHYCHAHVIMLYRDGLTQCRLSCAETTGYGLHFIFYIQSPEKTKRHIKHPWFSSDKFHKYIV